MSKLWTNWVSTFSEEFRPIKCLWQMRDHMFELIWGLKQQRKLIWKWEKLWLNGLNQIKMEIHAHSRMFRDWFQGSADGRSYVINSEVSWAAVGPGESTFHQNFICLMSSMWLLFMIFIQLPWTKNWTRLDQVNFSTLVQTKTNWVREHPPQKKKKKRKPQTLETSVKD